MRKPSSSRAMPSPIIFPGDEPFWEAAREGRLLIKHCGACGQSHYFPRVHCPHCGNGDTTWQAVSGKGIIYSHSIVAKARRPTAPAVVELEEGVRLHSVVMDADVYGLKIGDPVVIQFEPTGDGPPVPAFTTPASLAARAYSKAAFSALDAATDIAADSFRTAAVIGAGHMGSGISLALLLAGLKVVLVDKEPAVLEAAKERIATALGDSIKRGKLTESGREEVLARLEVGTAMALIGAADVVIEAVWEQMSLKQSVFAEIDQHARKGALLATNTSTLDIAEIAAATGRPADVVGMHFFNPAYVMKLVEVIKTPQVSAATLDATRALSRRLGKVPVTVGICDGFVGNRLMIARERQAARLLLEGALPEQIDRVLTQFGLPMGTFELQDMAGGIELVYRARQSSGQQDWLIEQLYQRGRLGRRVGKGYYRYEQGKRGPLPDPEVVALIKEASVQAGITRRHIPDDELVDRLILPMINEGAKLVEEGIVDRASDIDVVWQLGYGWPAWRGGPMYHADTMGIDNVLAKLTALHARHGDPFRPSDLLVRMASSGKRFVS